MEQREALFTEVCPFCNFFMDRALPDLKFVMSSSVLLLFIG